MVSRKNATKKNSRKTSKTSSYFIRSNTRVVKKLHQSQSDSLLLKKGEKESNYNGDTSFSHSSSILDIFIGSPEVTIDSPSVQCENVRVTGKSIDIDTADGLQSRGFTETAVGNPEICVSVEEPIISNHLPSTNRGADNTQDNPNPDGQKPPTTRLSPNNRHAKSTSPPKKLPPKLSPYFPKPLPLVETSCLPFPPISAHSFGLVQEQLSSDPFRLLIATIFLNRTRGPVAIPVFFKLFDKYPTIESMAEANHEDIVGMIHNLGFQNQRATKFIALAKKWLKSPPEKGRRYRKLHYPCKKDGADIGADETIGDDDGRVGWEIAHLPGVGAYAIDSWRIFCRDRLRGFWSDGSNFEDNDADEGGEVFEPEWKRVIPQDKELRAYLTWMWLREGWVWDWETGKRTLADAEMMQRAEKGGVVYEALNGEWILENSNPTQQDEKQVPLVRKAGFCLDNS
ncbi:hypothetical protein BGW36DRAFT_375294 [Talaromyces proteolyticus]|uniref:HhH-GPD domain-containing protein n=1 Tax=Talaromyces proteolyticus TaxID=1131652 RepID=A0AAD4KXE1_9EURO|nr:uncharacterized protein BGW36DRAFT_375294 [Talaromyces proteolyticus]KAH8700952.1 hypothetical protein BGW36DRAFT_375294 [Talaromyces proteolyticus]